MKQESSDFRMSDQGVRSTLVWGAEASAGTLRSSKRLPANCGLPHGVPASAMVRAAFFVK